MRLRDLARETILLGEETCAYRRLVATAVEEGEGDCVLRASFGTVMNLPYAVEANLGIAIVPATRLFSGGQGTDHETALANRTTPAHANRAHTVGVEP